MSQGFDLTKPVFQTPITSLELRTQFNALATHHEGVTAPTNPQVGWVWLDTSNPVDRIYRGFNGVSWIPLLGLDSPALILKFLSQLLDVQILAPANGEVLTYDSGVSKWRNLPASGGGLTLKQESRAITGLNTIQALSQLPVSGGLVQLFIGGSLAENGVDYTITGATINWISPAFNVDTPDTPAIAIYPTASSINIEQETLPVIAVNTISLLSQTPADANSVQLYVNGSLAENGVDYTITGTTINWISSSFNVQVTDTVVAYYIY